MCFKCGVSFQLAVAGLLVTIASWELTPLACADDVPDQVVVQTFIKPEGGQLRLLVRLPLVLLTEMDLPKRGPGYLDLANIDDELQTAAAAVGRQVLVYEQERPLVASNSFARISLTGDKSFASFDTAGDHIHSASLPDETEVFWNQGFFDVDLEYPIESDRSGFSLDVQIAPGLGDQLSVGVLYLHRDGSQCAYRLSGDTGRISLDPRWHWAAWLFVRSGFLHILEGIDHLLFLLCLVIPLRSMRNLLVVVTSFTVAHSITLVLASLEMAPAGPWFSPLVETLIAASIVYMAIENVFSVNLKRRWLMAFAFGLIHGFGFSFALQESIQFAGSHHLLSLLSFNIGVELGQIAVLLLLVPCLSWLFQRLDQRLLTIVLSMIVAHTAWHWMTERGSELVDVEWPVIDAALMTTLSRLLLVALLAFGAVWLIASRLTPIGTHTAKDS